MQEESQEWQHHHQVTHKDEIVLQEQHIIMVLLGPSATMMWHLVESLCLLYLFLFSHTAPGGIQVLLILPEGDGSLSQLLKQGDKLGLQ